MAILYYMKVNNPNNVNLFPPSLSEGDYATTLMNAVSMCPSVSSANGTTLQIFKDIPALTTYISSIALSGAQQAALTEWKTANNITITYEIFDLTTSETTAPTPF